MAGTSTLLTKLASHHELGSIGRATFGPSIGTKAPFIPRMAWPYSSIAAAYGCASSNRPRLRPPYTKGVRALKPMQIPLSFERLFAFLVLGHSRRQLLWFEVTRHPTAAWLTRQITEAFPWASAPAYLVRVMTAPMGTSSPLASGRWVSATGRSLLDRHGKMVSLNV
jgi:hypothetical protein